MDHAGGGQRARDRVLRVEQAFQRALHPPLRHRLARMLAAVEPHRLGAVADPQPVDRPVLRGPAQHVVARAGRGGPGDQVVVHLGGVGRMISEPGRSGLQRVPDGQPAVGVVRFRLGPVQPVLADPRLVPRPAERIGGFVEALEGQRDLRPRLSGDAEVEPLGELAVRVGGDFEGGGVAVGGDDADVAAVEGGGDADCHGRACRGGRRGRHPRSSSVRSDPPPSSPRTRGSRAVSRSGGVRRPLASFPSEPGPGSPRSRG